MQLPSSEVLDSFFFFFLIQVPAVISKLDIYHQATSVLPISSVLSKNNYMVIFDTAQIECSLKIWWRQFFYFLQNLPKKRFKQAVNGELRQENNTTACRKWQGRGNIKRFAWFTMFWILCDKSSICVLQDGQVLLFCDVPAQPKTKCRTHMEVFFHRRGVTQ